MPENFTSQTEEDTVSDIQQQIAEAKEKGRGSLAETAKIGELNQKGKKTNKLEKKQQDNTGDKDRESLPKRPSRNGQSTEQSKGREYNELDHSGSDKPPTPDYAKNENKEDPQDESEDLDNRNDKKKKPRPDHLNNGSESNEDKDLEEDSESASKEESSTNPSTENFERKEPEISKIVSAGDPVLYGDSIEDLGKDDGSGAWFYTGESEIVTDRSGGRNQQRSQVKIVYKEPGGNPVDEKMVTWSELTPTYNTAEEYKQVLNKIRQTYKKADAEGNTDYKKHLTLLMRQVGSYAMSYIKKAQEEIESNVKSEKDQLNKTTA